MHGFPMAPDSEMTAPNLVHSTVAEAKERPERLQRVPVANSFGTDILLQAQDPKDAASFCVAFLDFKITGEAPEMISVHGRHIKGETL